MWSQIIEAPHISPSQPISILICRPYHSLFFSVFVFSHSTFAELLSRSPAPFHLPEHFSSSQWETSCRYRLLQNAPMPKRSMMTASTSGTPKNSCRASRSITSARNFGTITSHVWTQHWPDTKSSLCWTKHVKISRLRSWRSRTTKTVGTYGIKGPVSSGCHIVYINTGRKETMYL